MLKKMKHWSSAAVSALISTIALTSIALSQTSSGGGSSVNTTTTTTSSSEAWYGHWWIWAVGVAVFLIVVIALTNRGGRTST